MPARLVMIFGCLFGANRFLLNFPNYFWKTVSSQLSLTNAMKIRVWNRGLVLNSSKKICDIQKRGAKKVFGGYIYLELSKKILFHQTRPLMRFRKEDFNQGDKTLRRLKGWLWSMSHKCCNSMQSLSAWPATGWVKKGGSGEFDCQCFKLWRSRRS